MKEQRGQRAFDRYLAAKAAHIRHQETPPPRIVAVQKAAPPSSLVREGRGWRIISHPRVSHAALEAHAQKIWNFTFHGLPWPRDWRVRWGKLHAGVLTLTGAKLDQCANLLFGRVQGLAIMSLQLIVVDEENQRDRTPRQFGTTLLHEMLHTQLRDAGHGPEFQAALKSATNYFFGAADEPDVAPTARPVPSRPVRV